jgi:hypothetical protein
VASVINATNLTNFTQMFFNCYSLTTIPLLDTGLGTNFTSMFSNCYALTAIPLLNTTLGTNFSQMFSGCYSLRMLFSSPIMYNHQYAASLRFFLTFDHTEDQIDSTCNILSCQIRI